MRIEVCHNVPNTQQIGAQEIRSGIINCAVPFSDKFWSSDYLKTEKVDYVIMNGGGTDVNWMLQHGKPKNWGKVFFLQCIPYYKLNNVQMLDKIKRCNFDGFLTWDDMTVHQFEIFGKPTIPVHIPYDLKSYVKYKAREKQGKMIINIKNFNDEYIGIPTLIRIIQKTQKDIAIYATVNPAYKQYMKELEKIMKLFNLKINLFEPTNHYNYMDKMSEFKLFLSADTRLNAERFIIDAGLVGGISIAPDNYIQRELFPEYTYDKHDIDKAVKMIKNWRDLKVPDHDMKQFSHWEFKRVIMKFIKENF